ncbi:acyl-CoA dehydrogenase family protein [Dermatobacter hominis]|uniref:acyl-CoA dehydrogenase family protein n=1 Tax=Dermatobacter hominis TaxID=2884263 RepID=UPI001D1044D5|nr:acyl-CoA dehydrogenase family protein [Dermatobacter hominis]UDY36685.1 acyl-CoA dehydrogenase family protein [Dermatobacter hominis]
MSDSEWAAWIGEHWTPDLTLGEWWDLLFDAGLAFPTWPAGLGGTGATAAEARRVAAALADAGAIAAPAGNGPNMGGPTVIEHGTAEQRERFVAPMGRGRAQWCQLFSEPGAGSDLASLSTRAELDGDEWVVSGQKVWSSKADVSEWGMLLCRTDLDVPKHRGITFLMLDMRQPGVEVRPLVQMNGASEFSEVFLTEARVPVADVVGAIGGGWDVARTTLAHERAASAAAAGTGAVVVEAGTIAGNLDRRVGDLVREWEAAGGAPRRQPPLLSSRAVVQLARARGVADRPALRDRVVRYFVHSEVYRRNGQRVRDLARARVPTALDGSAMKLDLARLAHESRDVSMALLGPDAMLAGDDAPDGGRVVRTGLSAFVPSLGGGTNEIQRNIVGERTLGLPREPAVDADVPFREMRRS